MEIESVIDMTSTDHRLLRQLGLAVLLKFGLLLALWWAFVRPVHVEWSADRWAAHIGAGKSLRGGAR